MKQLTILVTLLIVLVFSTGCTKEVECVPETITIKETIYVKQTIPTLPDEPTPTEYKSVKMNINGVVYYATDKKNSAIVIGNYKSYRSYTTTLRDILNTLKENK